MGRLLILLLVGLLAFALLADNDSNSVQIPKGWKCDGGQCTPIYGFGNAQALNARFFGESRPAADLPEALRQSNWLGTGGGGSCVHATTISMLRWLADGSGDPTLYELANTWPYSGGEYSSRWRERVEQAGLRYVMTVDGDPELLNWAIGTRRGCGIAYNGHCRFLVGYDEGTDEAIILDNNHVSRYDYNDWQREVAAWQRGGGWAFAFVYDPPTPVPTVFGYQTSSLFGVAY